ncbi:alpha-mannosidase [Arcanobacterium bovis]|uniref:Alpha-mannosidase n=1 Tax=Arcanobacterium bovis TaxID=2529275 RepID=A0A4V2KR01_9ACTO|nr:glycoside hydrolase family 38 C-terminal domain-containing protein [Arcanobacterium bovis]TBW20863.1 alpha-mannosidase [Arcanobacterium bovis]
MHDNRQILTQRVERTLREKILPAQHTVVAPLDVTYWRVPRESYANDRQTNRTPNHQVHNREIIGEPLPYNKIPWNEFESITAGTSWGAPWETVWFSVRTTIPELDLHNKDVFEAVIDLGWADHSAGFQCEGLVRNHAGQAIKALNPKNRWIPLPQNPGDTAEFSIEAAANPLLLAVPPFQPSYDGDKLTSSLNDLYTLTQADLTIRHTEVYALALDISILIELIQAQPHFGDREWRVLHSLNKALDALDLANIPATAGAAREILAPELAKPALPNAHRLSAVGHAHIDSAWLWPIRETKRKVVRTLANVVRLIEDGTGLVFAFPAAQHLAWVKELDPELFERIRECVRSGSIVPVGGMWVEPDAVLPGGEAMCRQLVEGLSFFQDELGVQCEEIWLPDSFGYSAALPQLAKEAGIERFLTQKISWNQVDTFPHHTLAWEGIDGTRIFTHFPPADTYGSEVTGAQLIHAVENFKDKGKATCSLLPFGYGDGGGGPTREMMDRLARVENLEGAPRTVVESPHKFFERAENDYTDLPVWVGELYLELHRGTFTSQISAKQGNRRSEALLREAELWCATAATRGLIDYPYDELRQAWHDLLLCQFHDILPGTSVAWVYREVCELHTKLAQLCEHLITQALSALCASNNAQGTDNATDDVSLGTHDAHDANATGTTNTAATSIVANASSFPYRGVPALSAGIPTNVAPQIQVDRDARTIITHGLTVVFDESGCCTSMRDHTGTEYIPAGERAGELHLHQDFPNMWDAWDIDPFYRSSRTVISDMTLDSIKEDAGEVRVHASARFDSSQVRLVWTLRADTIDLHVEADWHEQEKLLKMAFPTNIHTDRAQYETQMGYIERATHENTSWDAYRFEVSAHRWLRLANSTQSLAIANDSTYGWDVTRHANSQRGTWSLVRATLVKAAKFPDPEQDQGSHAWNFRVIPGASILRATQEGQLLNIGERQVKCGGDISGKISRDICNAERTANSTHSANPAHIPSPDTQCAVEPLIQVEGAIVESVALAPDRSGDVVVRLYEAEGGPRTAKLRINHARNVRCTNLLYQDSPMSPHVEYDGENYTLELGAFQIATLRFNMEER